MNKRFVVLIESSTKEKDDSFLKYIKDNGLGWWHWFPNSWLLKGSVGDISASDLRDAVHKIYGPGNIFIIELNNDGDTWSGYGPKSDDKDMFRWIRQNWSGK